MAEPKVRFKRDDGSSYPAWREYSISDLFTKIGDKNKDGQNTNVITNSAEFGLIPQRDYFDKDIAVEGNTGNYTIIQTGDFVYNPRKSSYAPMGPFNCYRQEEDGIVSPLYSCLRPKGVLNAEYLLWYFQTDKWYGYVNDHGAQNGARHDRVGMTDKILMGIPVTAPCEEEQKKIADFLSSVDDVIATSEQEVANLETQKKVVMKKIFSQEVRFKREDGSDFPAWEEVKIGQITNVFSSSRVHKEEWTESGVRFFRSSDVTSYFNGIENPNGKAYISEKLYEKLSAKSGKISRDDILITGGGSVGIPYIVSDNEPLYVKDADLLCIRSGVQHDSRYLYQFFLSSQFRDYLGSISHKGAIAHYTIVQVNATPLPLPCLEEQQKIADFLSNFDEAIASAKKELELWKELKKGLLQQMFV